MTSCPMLEINKIMDDTLLAACAQGFTRFNQNFVKTLRKIKPAQAV